MPSVYSNVRVLDDNYILQGILKNLRDKRTPLQDFRENLRQAGVWMTYEILSKEADRIDTGVVETPLGKKGYTELTDRVVQVMVLRAGQPLCEGGTRCLETTNLEHEIGVVDAKRIEVPGSLDFKYEMGTFKIPQITDNTLLVVYDPMLGTGGTICRVFDELNKRGNPYLAVSVHIVAAEYGLDKLRREHPHVLAYTLAVNSEGNKGLDQHGFIAGDLGDCGDRAFGKF